MYVIEILSSSKIKDFIQMTFPHFQRENERGQLKNALALGAYAQGLPVALALAQIEKGQKEATFCSLFVAPEHRGQGIGTALVSAACQEAVKRGCEQIKVTYMTNSIMYFFLEKILDKCGFEQEAAKNLFLEFDQEFYNNPLLNKLPPLPSNYEIFHFCELTSEERHFLQKNCGTLFPKELDPLLDEENFEPLNSYGMRMGKEIVGWMINHRVFPDTIRYTRLWVRNDLQKYNLGMHLIVRSVSAHKVHIEKIKKAIVVLSLKYPAMIRFAEKRLVPFSCSYYESKVAVKHL
jgi:GNAT superfamily N-acetyltransferase